MTNLPDMAGAAAEIELDGATYLIRPLTIDEFAQFERWVDDEPIRQAARNLDGLTPEQQIMLLTRAQEAATKASQTEPEKRQKQIASRMTSVSGISYLIWLCLRREQPELSQQDVARMITPDRLPYVQQRLDAINGFSSPSPPRATKKAPRKRKRTSR